MPTWSIAVNRWAGIPAAGVSEVMLGMVTER